MVVNTKNFGYVISRMVELVGQYGVVDQTLYGRRVIKFDKKNRMLEAISPFYILTVENVDIDLPIEEPNIYYNVMFQKWQPCPTDKEKTEAKIKEIFTGMDFIGKTLFYANNILNLMDIKREYVDSEQTRYVFVNGFLPSEDCAPMTFNIVNGVPERVMKNGIKFIVSENSEIPREYVKSGDTYAVRPVGKEGNNIVVDVLCRFGRMRSGLVVSTRPYTSDKLALVNKLEIVHPELTECTNDLSLKPGFSAMPPIHFGGKLLYDVLKVFTLAKSSKVELHFQEGISTLTLLTNVEQDKDDVKITCILAPLDLNARVSMC